MPKLTERVKQRVLIQNLYKKYRSVSKVANELKVGESTVRRWIYREDVVYNPRSGRPAAMSSEMVLETEKYLREVPGNSIRGCVKELKSIFPEESIGRETVRV